MREGVFWLSDELVREGAHDRALGSDGYVVITYLLSRYSTQKRWETSANQIGDQFGWGRNGDRARNAIDRAIKDRRLVKRQCVRDGRIVAKRCEYVVCAGGRRFTDAELLEWSRPLPLPPRKRTVPT
ncbi:hypothetical protein [Mycobacterium gallinarum]|nr:hypothetical protein [Mycobacterium gallinarum]